MTTLPVPKGATLIVVCVSGAHSLSNRAVALAEQTKQVETV